MSDQERLLSALATELDANAELHARVRQLEMENGRLRALLSWVSEFSDTYWQSITQHATGEEAARLADKFSEIDAALSAGREDKA